MDGIQKGSRKVYYSMKRNWLRISLQVFFFLLVALISVNHTLIKAGNIGIPFLSSTSLCAICPFGGVATFLGFITGGTWVQQVRLSATVMMGIIFLLSIILGPVFCSYVCPLGSIQEWFGKLGKKIFKNKYNKLIPKKLDKLLGYTRYVILIWVVIQTYRSMTLIFKPYDPFSALFHIWTDELAIGGLVVLITTLTLSFVIERPWCKYACPYGGLLGLFNKISIFKIKRNSQSCINCNKCDDVCPMNIDIANKKIITDIRCIRCMECVSTQACPVDETIELKVGKHTKEVK